MSKDPQLQKGFADDGFPEWEMSIYGILQGELHGRASQMGFDKKRETGLSLPHRTSHLFLQQGAETLQLAQGLASPQRKQDWKISG